MSYHGGDYYRLYSSVKAPDDDTDANIKDWSGCFRSHTAESWRTPSPLFGHEEQCYRDDNKCHCSSSPPFKLPPEPQESPQSQMEQSLPSEPPLTVRLTPEQIRYYYSTTSRASYHSSASKVTTHGLQDHTSTQTRYYSLHDSISRDDGNTHQTFPNNQWPDEPPSYDSLFLTSPVWKNKAAKKQ